MTAVIGMAVPLIGALDMSLPPCVVPTVAEVEFRNVGVRLIVALYPGVCDEAVIEEVTARMTFTMVVAVLVPSSFDVAVTVTLPVLAGAVKTPEVLIVPALADQSMSLVAPPVAVVLKVVPLLTATVGAAGVIAFTTTVCGVTVTELSTKSPAALVERNQYVLSVVMAVVVICVPLVGVAEMSLPPNVVPTEAELEFANVGVRFTIAP